MGLLDSIFDGLFGDTGKAPLSGAFPGMKELGGAFSDKLLERLNTPVGDTDAFKQGSTAIRDQLDAMFKTGRQRLGDSATTGGWLDSGAVTSGMLDLERAEMQAFSSAIRDLFLALDDRSMEGVLPFLAAGAGEGVNIHGINIGARTAARGQNVQFTSDLFSSVAEAGSFT